MQIERRSGIMGSTSARGFAPSSNNICSNAIIKCLESRPGSELRVTSDNSEAAVAVAAAAASAVGAVFIHPAAAELYNALVSAAEQHPHKLCCNGCCGIRKSLTWTEPQLLSYAATQALQVLCGHWVCPVQHVSGSWKAGEAGNALKPQHS